MSSDSDSKEIHTHHEGTIVEDAVAPRRRSSVAAIVHTEVPVWEQRRTYGKHGMLPVLTSLPPVTNATTRLYGRVHFEIRLLVRSFRHNGGLALRIRVGRFPSRVKALVVDL